MKENPKVLAVLTFFIGVACGAAANIRPSLPQPNLVDCNTIAIKAEVGEWSNLHWSRGPGDKEPWTFYMDETPVCFSKDPIIEFTVAGDGYLSEER